MSTHENFEDRLLAELRRVVAARPAPAHATAVPAHPRRARLVAAGAGLAAATAGVALLATSGDRTPSAYAVSPAGNGDVTVSIRSLHDAAGLQHSLRAAGVPAVVNYEPSRVTPCELPPLAPLPGGKAAQIHSRLETGTGPSFSPRPPGGPGLPGPGIRFDGDGATFTIHAGDVRPGERVYVTTSAGSVHSVSLGIAKPGARQPRQVLGVGRALRTTRGGAGLGTCGVSSAPAPAR